MSEPAPSFTRMDLPAANGATGDIGDYGILLHSYGFHFTKKDIYYEVGAVGTTDWELFISVMVLQLPQLLSIVLPVCKDAGLPFRLICDRDTHFSLNHGEFGLAMVGRVLLIYPASETAAHAVANRLAACTDIFKGPNLSLYKNLAGVLFSDFKRRPGIIGRIVSKFTTNTRRTLVFRTKKSIGRYYRLRELIRFSPKGEIHKGINLRNLEWCIIKRGRHCGFEDIYGRTIRDRLLWQAYLSRKIPAQLPIQQTIAYIEQDHDTYLVLQYVEGMIVGERIEQLNPHKEAFNELSLPVRKQLLQLYLQVLLSVSKLHELGIIHRDINEGNLIVTKKQTVYIIDLEIAYDTKAGLPDPVFFPGASVYRAPEQNEKPPNGFGEDIYSLGCLLLLILTSDQPVPCALKNYPSISQHLRHNCDDADLVELCEQCLSVDPHHRPDIDTMLNSISCCLLTIH